MSLPRDRQALLGLSLCFLLLPVLAFGDCTCEGDSPDQENSHGALSYKLGAIACILIGGTLGVCLPILGKAVPALSPGSDLFFMVKAFAAGVILATGYIHVFPDAYESLTSPCLTSEVWGSFPFAGFIAMMAAIATLQVDMIATSHYTRRQLKEAASLGGAKNKDTEAGGANAADNDVKLSIHHVHGPAAAPPDSSASSLEILRHKVVSQVLEVGIVVHSVIIGISLGASQSTSTIRPLIAALTFHQFFEGMGLGGCITQANFKSRAVIVMALFFSLTTPVGIGIGIGVSNTYNENSPTALIIQGILNSASAGILVYMALVDLLAADFMSPRMLNSGKLQVLANASLLIGAGFMSLLAKWA
ncbi:zinc transporter 5-like [Punica granatum]|uniref:Zinc transporter 5-like n=1 Tax=Punica granatum TaxID=22663 RepID=A0A218XB32_PUNGR|nr:zinc transporter 5-like [Punica granatum]OWM81552.1 hypothetical protein CDL15_Pgr007590 [Punica granatum]